MNAGQPRTRAPHHGRGVDLIATHVSGFSRLKGPVNQPWNYELLAELGNYLGDIFHAERVLYVLKRTLALQIEAQTAPGRDVNKVTCGIARVALRTRKDDATPLQLLDIVESPGSDQPLP
jgi:hypothetical protein